MKICAPHWQALRKAIDDRGLSGLISKDGRDAAARMAKDLEGEAEPRDFDPLMAATMAIYGACIRDLGLVAFQGDICPLCWKGPATAENWINGSADDQLARARSLGLAPGVQ